MYDLNKTFPAKNNFKVTLKRTLPVLAFTCLMGTTPAFAPAAYAQWANGDQAGTAPDQQPYSPNAPASSSAPAPVATAQPTYSATTTPGTATAVGTAGPFHPWDDKNKQPKVSEEQDRAVKMARDGQYDEALRILSGLHQKDPANQSVARDEATVLAWSGKDQAAVDMYAALPAQEPDYVLAAVAKSYRNLNQLDKSLAVYQTGAQLYPDNVIFAEGQIRVLSDQGQLDEALAKADEDLHAHGDRPEIVAARKDVAAAILKRERSKAVELGRQHNYKQSLAILQSLHQAHPDDVGITQDYLAVLDWSGGHNAEVINLYKSLPSGNQPDYVLEAVGHAYRNQHKYSDAAAIYHKGLVQNPNSEIFASGEIRTLMDAGRTKDAQTRISQDIKAHGNRPAILAARRDIDQVQSKGVRRHAIELARKGHYEESLVILRKLHAQNPRDVNVTRDLTAVLGYAGDNQGCVTMFESLHSLDQPDYVLDAAGLAYRNLHQPDKALALYQRGLHRSPGNVSFMAGAIHSLADQGFIEKALALANEDLRRHGDRLDVLLAAGDAADQYNQYDAMRYYQAAMKVAPKNRQAIEGAIRNADRMGAPEAALKIADEHPGIMPADEYRRIQNDQAGAMVRFGMMQPENGEDPNAATDRAIAKLDGLIEQWQGQPDAAQNLRQARYDRIIAYHNRNRMQDVVTEYNALISEGAPVPTYVLGAVGDAYLDLHQPQKAKDLYLKVLETEPDNYSIRRQLFYAYVDCDDFKHAYATIDQLVAEQPVGEKQAQTQLIAGEARLYAGDVPAAAKIILPAAEQLPNSPAAHEVVGNLYDAEGLPRKALAEYKNGDQIANGKDVGNRVGIANTELELRHYQVATDDVKALAQEYPDNANVKRAERNLDVHNMAELRFTAGYDFEPTTSNNVTGGEGYGLGVQLYSAPIYNNFRIFAGEQYANQREPNEEGHVGVSRTDAGVEYRNGGLVTSIAPTYNHYNGSERVGVEGVGSYDINDHWTVAGTGEKFSQETPFRALNQGITSDYVGGHVVWQQDETRSARLGASAQPFSDGNFRTEADANFTQRLYTRSEFRVDGLLDGSESNNSGNEDRPYYNPKNDVVGLIGAKGIQTLYQHYSTLWQQALTLEPGAYFQTAHGFSPDYHVRYEQRIFLSDTFEAGAGFNFRRQDYDGNPENDYSLTLDVLERF